MPTLGKSPVTRAINGILCDNYSFCIVCKVRRYVFKGRAAVTCPIALSVKFLMNRQVRLEHDRGQGQWQLKGITPRIFRGIYLAGEERQI